MLTLKLLQLFLSNTYLINVFYLLFNIVKQGRFIIY